MNRINQALTAVARVVAGWLPDGLLLGGAAVVSYGVGMMHRPAGLIVAGLFLLAGGWLLARGGK